MARNKLPDDEKKPSIGVTINTELLNKLEEHIKDKTVNRSKYIETLIKEDIKNRNIKIKNKFD